MDKNSEGMSILSGVWEDIYQKGKIETLKEIVINMLRENTYPIEAIAKVTKLPVEDIEKIKSEISAT